MRWYPAARLLSWMSGKAARWLPEKLSGAAAAIHATIHVEYARWIDAVEAPALAGACAEARVSGPLPAITVLIPLYGISASYVQECYASLCAQEHRSWEAILVCDGLQEPLLESLLTGLPDQDSRVKILRHPENLGIAAATQTALAAATSEFVAFLDGDDVLAPAALLLCAHALSRHSDVDLLYTDQDFITDWGWRLRPMFKPDFDPTLLLSANYINHLVVARRSACQVPDLFPAEVTGAQDWNFCLTIAARARRIEHVPFILYHWRMRPGSVAGPGPGKPYVHNAIRRVLFNHLPRLGHPTCSLPDLPSAWYTPTFPAVARSLEVVFLGEPGGDVAEIVRYIRTKWCGSVIYDASSRGPRNAREMWSRIRSASAERLLLLHAEARLDTEDLCQLDGWLQFEGVGLCAPARVDPTNGHLEVGLSIGAGGEPLPLWADGLGRHGFPWGYAPRTVQAVGDHALLLHPARITAAADRSDRPPPQTPEAPVTTAILELCSWLHCRGLRSVLVPSVRTIGPVLTRPHSQARGTDPHLHPSMPDLDEPVKIQRDVIAPALPLVAPARISAALAHQYLRGTGLEIGGLSAPMPVPPICKVFHLDRLHPRDAAVHYPELPQQSLVNPNLIGDGTDLGMLRDRSLDFLIASHVLEHLPDPMGALANWCRVVRPGGHLLLAVPDKRYTFDRNRPRTTLAHLIADRGQRTIDSEHYREWVQLKEFLEGEAAAAEVDRMSNIGYAVHAHVWTHEDLMEIFDYMVKSQLMPVEIVECHAGWESTFLLRRSGSSAINLR